MHPVTPSSFVVHTLCVFFKGSRFYITLVLLHSSPVSIETILSVLSIFNPNLCLSLEKDVAYTVQLLFMCSIVSFYGIIYNRTFGTLVLHFLPPPLHLRRSPLFDLHFFLLRGDPISQSTHSWRSYELQITASRFIRSLIV